MSDERLLLKLIEQGEHQQQDFKYKITDAPKLAKSVSAFANTEGGRLLIGVRDDGNLSGVRDEEEIFMMHEAAERFCHPSPTLHFDTLHARGKTIVIASVPRWPERPVYALDHEGHRTAYLRIADQNVVASPIHLEIWKQETDLHGSVSHYDDTEARLMQALAEHPALTLNRLLKHSQTPRRPSVSTLARWIRYGLVDLYREGDNFHLRLADE